MAGVLQVAFGRRMVFEDTSFAHSPDKPLIASLSLVADLGQTVATAGSGTMSRTAGCE